VALGGCPSLFLPPRGRTAGSKALISIRHPARMSVHPSLQWRVASDVQQLIGLLTSVGYDAQLLCHDIADLEFAAAFPGAPVLYETDVSRFLDLLTSAAVNITYRLHAFLPCLALGVPSIHFSYDERGRSMLETLGMGQWEVFLQKTSDVAGLVASKLRVLNGFEASRLAASQTIKRMKDCSIAELRRFSGLLKDRRLRSGAPS
jgi:polysaccharide pyruvyl transferase WcaK-like protein